MAAQEAGELAVQTPGRDRKPRPERRRARDSARKADLCDDQKRVLFEKVAFSAAKLPPVLPLSVISRSEIAFNSN